jgi:Ca2+-binding EF-hand superfamily protein
MKHILLLACCLIIISTSLKLTSKNSHDFSEQWSKLFGTSTKTGTNCNKEQLKDDFKLSKEEEDKRTTGLPFVKKDLFDYQKFGPGPIDYLYDYLDPVLEAEVIDTFDKLYKAALETPDDETYDDPYTKEKMLLAKANGVPITEDQSTALKKYFPNADFTNFDKSISARKLKRITKDWQWNVPADNNYPKKIVDMFDYNGEGRLNMYEFLQYSIINSKGVQKPGAKFNYLEIFIRLIDPIFAFLDCDNDSTLTSEEMFDKLKQLKRGTVTGYDMYGCKLPTSMGPVWTNACNDFILRYDNNNKSKVTLEEFRTGILIGYLIRDVKQGNIDTTKNGKDKRWADNGGRDLECEKLFRFAGIKK